MDNNFYSQFFPGSTWKNYTRKICDLLKKETVLITALPDAGISFFLKHVEESYKKRDLGNQLLVSFEVLQAQEEVFHLSRFIKEQINILLEFPSEIADLSCTDTIKKLVQEKKEIVIIINRFERLQGKKEPLAFLNSLRAINPRKVRFFISCYISCVTRPVEFKEAGMLTTANVEFLPIFTREETTDLLNTYKKIYGWTTEKSLHTSIYELSGGFPGLIKYMAKFASDDKLSSLSVKTLISQPAITFKLDNLMQTLEGNKLIVNGKISPNRKDLLLKLGFIEIDNSIRIKLLNKFKLEKIELINLAKYLSSQEIKLFSMFTENLDNIQTLDQVADTLWEDKSTQKFSLWSIYKVISNLNKKIKGYGLEIENFKGRGYALTTDPNLSPSQAKSLLENIRKEDRKN
ncbi:MAG: hypothetical protein PHS44_06595 [Candidatus Dojkabacteria bacterium]|nr:hypothetical protein [Candidatus Dojkabacteria bacterium]